ncbi:hypothetical protein EMCRGX_G008358 [Ephydatia muelleri]
MFGRKAILPLDLDAGVHQGPCNEAEVTIFSQENEIQQKESQHKALLVEKQLSAQKKQKELYDKKHSASPSRSAVSLSPTKDGTALALSPSAKVQHLLYCKKVITQVNISIHPYSWRSQRFCRFLS